MAFYDTIGLSRAELDLAWQKADQQDKKILQLLKKHGPMTAFRIHYVLIFRNMVKGEKQIEFDLSTERGYKHMMRFVNTPAALTSVRRSLDTLKKLNLIKVLRKKDECLGKAVAEYTLKTDNNDWIASK